MKDDNENESDKKEKILVTHGTGVYDVTSFSEIHPGGSKYLKAFNKKDITNAMNGPSHRHGPFAMKWLSEFRVGFADEYPDFETPKLNLPNNDGFVDWTKPVLWQVGDLKERYTEWIMTPTDRPLRLFHSDFCEYFSNNKWYIVPIFWIPIVCFFASKCVSGGFSPFETALLFLFGIGLWTLTEYVLHRFVFHLIPYEQSGLLSLLTDNKFWITFHFIMHGQHHKVPFDKGRLVFPVVPAAVIVYGFRNLLHALSGPEAGEGLISGAIFGYVAYDIMHYFTHHGDFAKGSLLDNIRRAHVGHHFIDPNKTFGISSQFWDGPFGTRRKVAMD